MAEQKKAQRAQRTIITTMDEAEAQIRFAVAGVGTVTLDMTQLHKDVLSKAAYVGMYNRMIDAAALGKDATPREKFDELRRLAEHYMTGTGEWAVTRAASAGGAGRREVVEAMVYVFGIDATTAEMRIKALAQKRGIEDKEAVRLFATSDKVAARISEVRASRATLDADAMMLEAMEATVGDATDATV